jgi:hypothetical protein
MGPRRASVREGQPAGGGLRVGRPTQKPTSRLNVLSWLAAGCRCLSPWLSLMLLGSGVRRQAPLGVRDLAPPLTAGLSLSRSVQ